MSKKKTHEEYVAELVVKNPNIEVIGEYAGANTKITHHCLLHDVYWETTPSRVLHGSGCEMCRKEKFRISHSKTNEEYIKEINNVNSNIVALEKYIDAKTPILHLCTIHNVEWKAYPDNILHGHGCYKCGNDKTSDKNGKTHKEYIKELEIKNPNVIALGTYINSLTPILHKCLVDEYEWYVSPANLLFGRGCPKCCGNIKKEHDEYIFEVESINKDIEVIEQYINARTPISHKCRLCGNIWKSAPYSILQGTGCPCCQGSKGEKQVSKWLDAHNIIYESQKKFNNCRNKNSLPFDFYLPEYNICIEYDGEQHYRPVEYFGGQYGFECRLKHDGIKNDYCKNNNILLLRIPYYKNVEEELNNFLFN